MPHVPTPLLARLAPWLLLPLYLAALLVVDHFSAPLPQDPAYHAFADSRALFGIANFADVVSNLAILIPAMIGLIQVQARDAQACFGSAFERAFATLFFLALVTIGFGSSWYHLAPDNDRLLLDRLPIALAFTSLIAWLIAERSWLRKPAALALLPWIALGPACVLWWYIGETAGAGDLRPYLVLYAFAFLVPPLLMRMPSQYNRRSDYWAAYLAFVLGMLCDRFDHEIFELLGGMLSGHTLKHLLMGYAVAVLARMLHRRRLRFR